MKTSNTIIAALVAAMGNLDRAEGIPRAPLPPAKGVNDRRARRKAHKLARRRNRER